MKKTPSRPDHRDPVAKNLNRFNKCATHRNRKKDYERTPKHRTRDFGVRFCSRPERLCRAKTMVAAA